MLTPEKCQGACMGTKPASGRSSPSNQSSSPRRGGRKARDARRHRPLTWRVGLLVLIPAVLLSVTLNWLVWTLAARDFAKHRAVEVRIDLASAALLSTGFTIYAAVFIWRGMRAQPVDKPRRQPGRATSEKIEKKERL